MIRSYITYFVTLFFLILCVFSCKQMNPKDKELEALDKTVMSIHDDVMPKINNIRKLDKNIRKRIDAGDLEFNDDIKFKIISKRLEQEDEAMMEWMQQYKKPDFENYEEAKAYLLDQKIKIEKVRSGMLRVIDDAEKILNK